MKDTNKARKNDTIIGRIASIFDMLEDYGLSDELMETAKTHIGFVSDFYSITPVQAVLFSLFIGQGEDKQIYTYNI